MNGVLNMVVNSLFPTPVAFFKLDRELSKTEDKFLKVQETRGNTGNTTSLNNKVLANNKLANIRKFLQDSLDQYFAEVYAPKYPVSLEITQSWLNYTKPGQYHHKHAHPNSFISGVFYVQANKVSDKIFFYNDEYTQLQLPTDNYNTYNSKSWWFEVNTCDLVLFPSSLTHMVETVKGDDERISLSFNTFLKGYIGEDDELTGLHL